MVLEREPLSAYGVHAPHPVLFRAGRRLGRWAQVYVGPYCLFVYLLSHLLNLKIRTDVSVCRPDWIVVYVNYISMKLGINTRIWFFGGSCLRIDVWTQTNVHTVFAQLMEGEMTWIVSSLNKELVGKVNF